MSETLQAADSPRDRRAPLEPTATDEPQYLSHQQIVIVLVGLMAGVMLVGVPVVALAFLVALFLKEVPLRTMQRQSPEAPAAAESAPAEALSAGV